ncbi:MAG: hypothetical protein HYV41_00095 [Candidatus Magasanikbacteria bacterium]|nr:hypothetical protein [Candidatus Magasanikbacteria bacterium]
MAIDKQTLDFIAKNPEVSDEKTQRLLLELAQEPSRQALMKWVIYLIGGLHLVFILIGAVLVYNEKIQFRDMLDLILVLGWVAGSLTTIINFYFKK